MVGIGIAACRSSYCACSPDTCCIPNEWQWIWNAPGCALHNVSMHMVHLRPDQFAPDSTYHFTGGPAYPPTDGKVSWGFVGDVWAAAECDDKAVNAGALVYCAMIDGQEAIVAEAFCFDPGQNIVGYKIGYTYDFSCDPFSFSIVTEDELCCGCNGDGGTNVSTDCCTGVPTTLYATITGSTGCAEAVGLTVPLAYDALLEGWQGSNTVAGNIYAFFLFCDSGNWVLGNAVTGISYHCSIGPASPSPESCSPLELVFTDKGMDGGGIGGGASCCGGAGPGVLSITVTE